RRSKPCFCEAADSMRLSCVSGLELACGGFHVMDVFHGFLSSGGNQTRAGLRGQAHNNARVQRKRAMTAGRQ
ncbi:MAG: hypothetical protein LBF87_03060, partial [Treponema sp.]|nr:hypothetical protein [Treponema sp.]